MKKQIVSNSTRSNIFRLGFALLLMMNLSSAFANPGTGFEEPYVSIKYAGLKAEAPQFQVDLVNDNEEPYLFIIQDVDGIVLYKERINKKVFNKTFSLKNDDFYPTKLIFSVTGEKSKKTQVYEVNTLVRTVRDVEITKL